MRTSRASARPKCASASTGRRSTNPARFPCCTTLPASPAPKRRLPPRPAPSAWPPSWGLCWWRPTPARGRRGCRATMRTGISASVRGSTSTPPRSPGRRTTACTATSWRSCRGSSPRRSPRFPQGRESSAIPWAAMARWCVRCATLAATLRYRHSRRSRRRRTVPGARKRSPATSARSASAGRATTRAPWRARRASRAPSWSTRGAADRFLAEQLKPELLAEACRASGTRLQLRLHEGYDHSYYFISTFMEDHLRHHARSLCN